MAFGTTNDLDTFVTIRKTDHEKLLAAKEKLDALEAAGVDNWEGYDVAFEIMREMSGDADED